MSSLLPPAELANEATYLSPWLSAFERFFGQPVQLHSDGDEGQLLKCPPVFRPIELIGSAHHFKMHAACAEHMRRMGFDWTPEGRVLTVPTPATFNARLAKYGFADAGYRLAWVQEQSSTLALGPWLHRYMRGQLTVQSCTQKYFDDCLAEGPKGKKAAPLDFLLTTVIHDLSVHALNYHLIPHSALAEMQERIHAALSERVGAWAKPAGTAPVTLTYFYDNDVNRYCYEVWCRTPRPGAFADVFLHPKNFPQLLAALDVRLQETRAGIGDVASGQFEDMKPLQQTRFALA